MQRFFLIALTGRFCICPEDLMLGSLSPLFPGVKFFAVMPATFLKLELYSFRMTGNWPGLEPFLQSHLCLVFLERITVLQIAVVG